MDDTNCLCSFCRDTGMLDVHPQWDKVIYESMLQRYGAVKAASMPSVVRCTCRKGDFKSDKIPRFDHTRMTVLDFKTLMWLRERYEQTKTTKEVETT